MKGRLNIVRAVMPLALVAAAAISQAQIVSYSTFGPGDSFVTGAGATISGSTSPVGEVTQGDQFVAGVGGSLHSLRLALGHVTGANAFEVSMYKDSGTDEIGPWITTWSGSGLGQFGEATSILTLPNAFPEIVLDAGSKYWVVCRVAGDTWSAWNYNDQGVNTRHATSIGGSAFGYMTNMASALEVNVAAVPEPASIAAIGLGLVGALRRRARK